MEIIWSPKAKDNLLETLEYWEVHYIQIKSLRR